MSRDPRVHREIPAEALGVVLAEVRDMGPVSARQIADGTGIGESAVRRHLAALEESGLVESDDYQRRARVWLPLWRADP